MRNANVLFVFLSLYTVLTIASSALVKNQVPEFTHKVELDTRGDVILQWAYDDSYIIFKMQAKTEGWMGLGVGPSASMAGSDIAFMWVKDGVANLKDMHATVNGPPILDTKQDIDLISGSLDQGIMTFVFGRSLATCEKEDFAISPDTLRILYAFGPNVPQNAEKLTIGDKHPATNRGARSVRILSQQSKPIASTDDNLESFVILNNKTKVPNEDTYYHCIIAKFKIGGKRHVIQVEPIIQPGNELHVHHMIVYTCHGLVNSTVAGEYGHQCYNRNMPDEFKKCQSLMFTWAIGGGIIVYPEYMGLPLDDTDDELYFQLETHYDNPEKKAGIVDSSGIKFTYTSDLRENDIGMIEMGQEVNPFHFIPGGIKEWRTMGRCHEDCLASGFPNGVEYINIFAVMLHSHLYGVQMKLHHYRNGTELPPLSKDNFYDFNYQEYDYLREEIKFYPGDSLVMECVYNTETRDEPVYGGLGTNEEMCLSFIQYYPQIGVTECHSSPDYAMLTNVLGINPELRDQMWYASYLEKVSGKNFNVTEINEKYNIADYRGTCQQRNAGRNRRPDEDYITYKVPNITPYKEDVCGRSSKLNPSYFFIVIMAICMIVF